MFKRIAQVPDFEIEVLVALPGDAEDPPPLYMTVAYRPARELDALTTEGGLPGFARGVVRGWRGHEAPFSAEEFDEFLSQYPSASRAIWEAYTAAIGKAKRKN